MNERCPNCGRNRWRTVTKGEAWRCRHCGFLRKESDDAEVTA